MESNNILTTIDDNKSRKSLYVQRLPNNLWVFQTDFADQLVSTWLFLSHITSKTGAVIDGKKVES